MSYLECNQIRQSFGSKFSMNLSFSMDKGELLCIIGPSGSGKSTLLSLIAGIEVPQGGSIIIDGEDITNMSIRKRHIGMVFQDFSLFPSMNVEKNIQYGMKDTLNKEERTRELLSLVGLEGYGKRSVNQLSGGEAQRIALARAIAAEPRILLLDEPLSALDAPLRKKLRSVIKQIHEKTGTTMLYVTHDREEAFAIADRILVMKAGRIEAIGEPEELYRNPPTLFVASFTGEGSTVPMSLFKEDDEERTAFIRPEDIRIVDQTEKENSRGIILHGAEVLETEFNGTSYTVNLNYDGFPLIAISDTKPEEKTVSLSISKNAIHQFSTMIRH